MSSYRYNFDHPKPTESGQFYFWSRICDDVRVLVYELYRKRHPHDIVTTDGFDQLTPAAEASTDAVLRSVLDTFVPQLPWPTYRRVLTTEIHLEEDSHIGPVKLINLV